MKTKFLLLSLVLLIGQLNLPFQMKAHNIKATISGLDFTFGHSISVESSWENLTDTATFVCPSQLKFQGQNIASGTSLFNVGDPVKLEMGYNGEYDQFEGFLNQIKPGTPLKFMIEDSMWKLKQTTVDLSYRNLNLQELLADISPIPYQSADVTLGKFRVQGLTPAQVLKLIKDEYSLYSWVRNGKLYAGLAYWPDLGRSHIFKFRVNVIESNLTYRKQTDIKLRAKAISFLQSGEKLEASVGDPSGELRTLTYYNIESEQELKDLAAKDLEKYKFEGWMGNFLTFGQPYVQHGDIVSLIDPDRPDLNTKAFVKKVKRSAGVDGYRQRIYLDNIPS